VAGRAAQGAGEPSRSAVDFLSEVVGRHFKVRHIEGDRFRLAFFSRETAESAPVRAGSEEVDAAFDALRVELKARSYLPTIQLIGEDGVITVSRVVDPEFKSTRVNWIFFVLTLLSVQSAGAQLWAWYISPRGPTGLETGVQWLSAEAQGGGFLFFALPLLAILGLHEMGHFFTARHYNVRASLPFFIPSLPPLGTFGAFISMRDPMPSRRVIFDIGLSGPMVGFVASIGVTIAGALFMQGTPSPARPELGGFLNLGSPLMFEWILQVVGSAEDSYLHPTLFAGWAGFLVTAFNLIPAAQLDGGHVFFSLLGNGPKRESRAVAISIGSVVGISVLGVLFGYYGWLLLIIIVLLTIRHPPPLNQISALGGKRLAAGLAAILVFAVSFSPAPINVVFSDFSFDAEPSSGAVVVPAGGFANYSFNVTNLGNTFNELKVEVRGSSPPFTAIFEGTHTSTSVLVNRLEFINRTVNVTVVALTLTEGEHGAVYLVVSAVSDPTLQKPIVISAVTGAAHPGLSLASPQNVTAAQASLAQVPIEAFNTGDVPLNLTFSVDEPKPTWLSGFELLNEESAHVRLAPGGNATLLFLVDIPAGASQGANVTFTVRGADSNWTSIDESATFEVRAGS